MQNFVNLLYNHGFALLIGIVPLVFVVLLTAWTTRWRRWIAAILAATTAGVLAFEIYSNLQEGNLTGLIWILSTPVIVLLAALLGVAEWFDKSPRRSKGKNDSVVSES